MGRQGNIFTAFATHYSWAKGSTVNSEKLISVRTYFIMMIYLNIYSVKGLLTDWPVIESKFLFEMDANKKLKMPLIPR